MKGYLWAAVVIPITLYVRARVEVWRSEPQKENQGTNPPRNSPLVISLLSLSFLTADSDY